MNLSETFLRHLAQIRDPRINNYSRRHYLVDIFVITILGTICGADEWNEIYDFAEAKKIWLETFLTLPNGIPSDETFRQVFMLINPKEFEQTFLEWIASLPINLDDQIIAIEDKTLCSSIDRKHGILPIHLVSVWASEYKILLGQMKTKEKSLPTQTKGSFALKRTFKANKNCKNKNNECVEHAVVTLSLQNYHLGQV